MFALSNKNKFYWFLFDQQARHKIVHIFEAFISRSARNSCTTVDAALAKNTDYLYCLNHQRTHHMIPLTPIGTFRILRKVWTIDISKNHKMPSISGGTKSPSCWREESIMALQRCSVRDNLPNSWLIASLSWEPLLLASAAAICFT